MATYIKAVSSYLPRIKLGETADVTELGNLIGGRTAATKADVKLVFDEMGNALIELFKIGRPLYIKGVGRFTPTVNLKGKMSLNFTLDKELQNTINSDIFNGTISNKSNIGLSKEEIITMWNEENPDDLIPVT
jgi:hypothetical protein